MENVEIEIIDNEEYFVNEKLVNRHYLELMHSLEFRDDKERDLRVKQNIANMLTNAYQNGQMSVRQELLTKIEKLNFRIMELKNKYETEEKEDSRGYGERRYQGD